MPDFLIFVTGKVEGAETELSATPAPEKLVGDVEQIQCLADGVIDNIVDGFRTMVKGRNWRQEYRSGLCRKEHVAKMTGVERCLAHQQDQPPPFLEMNIGGPREKIA